MSLARAAAGSLAALALFAAPAYAGDVVRVKLGSTIEDLITAPDGGAWVEIYRPTGQAIGRALPGGGFRTSGTEYGSIGRTVGPDGQAWFKLGSRDYVRSDGAGNVTLVELPGGPSLGRPIATGPDGTLWNLTPTGGRFAHVTPQGAVTYTASRVPKCANADDPIFMSMERATDGALWIIDQGCERLIRVTAAATSVVAVKDDVEAIAADADGGMWFAASAPSGDIGHVDVAGTVKRFTLKDAGATDVAVAPDGSAWFTLDTCTLARATLAGDITTAPAPIPAWQLGFDPAGGLWLTSHTRLVHVAPGEPFGPCDQRPPSVRITPGHDGETISLKALRRGVRIAVREPAVVEVSGYPFVDSDDDAVFSGPVVTRVMTRAGSFRYRLRASDVRRLAAGKRPGIGLYVSVRDANGNQGVVQSTLRIRR